MSAQEKANALVDPEWVAMHRDDPNVCLIEIAGLGQEKLQAYRGGHIPGAYGWRWQEALWDSHMRDFPSPAEFARRLGVAGIGNDTTVVFYGEGVQFGIYAWWVFRYCGHENVRILDGARYGWMREGRPLTKEVPPPRPARDYHPGKRRESMRILRDEVLQHLGHASTLILDGRSPEEFRGERVGASTGPDVGALRYGRIPGAKHMFFEVLLTEDKRFKQKDELRFLVEARGVTPDRDTVVYCRMSHRATVLHFVLTELLGLQRVRVYDGSWTEWGNLVGVPVER